MSQYNKPRSYSPPSLSNSSPISPDTLRLNLFETRFYGAGGNTSRGREMKAGERKLDLKKRNVGKKKKKLVLL